MTRQRSAPGPAPVTASAPAPALTGARIPMARWHDLLTTTLRARADAVVALHLDEAILLEEVGDLVVALIARPLPRRAAADALRLRVEALRSSDPTATTNAASATQRLRDVLLRVDEQRGTTSEPAGDVVVTLTGGDLAGGCVAAARLVEPRLVVGAVLHARHLLDVPAYEVTRLLEQGLGVAEAVRLGTLLGQRQWWPAPLREFAFAGVQSGRPIDALVQCLDELGFSQLNIRQQGVALALLVDPHSPYGLDGTAIGAAARGISMDGGALDMSARRAIAALRRPEPAASGSQPG